MDLQLPELATWINGRPEASPEVIDADLHDPNTGEWLQSNRASSAEQVDRALAAAAAAHASGAWADTGLDQRADRLMALADRLDRQQTIIAELDSLSSGVTLRETRLFASSLGDTVRHAVDLARQRGEASPLAADQGPVLLRRIAWGPTALIAPWNAPSAVAIKKMAYALIVGAPVVLKPSEASPWSAQVIAEAVAELGLPPGVFSLVLGDGRVGGQICGDPRIRAISMTGSTQTGRLIAQASAPNLTRLRLELGSNNPVIVLDDADVSVTANALAAGMVKLNGQWCEAPRRVLAHHGLHADLVDALHERLRSVRIGSSFDDASDIGPMAYRARRDDLVAQRREFAESGARATFQENVPAGGWFFAPTVVTGPQVPLPREIFGPMLVMEPFSDLDAALVAANEGPHGLAGYVFSSDVERAIVVGGHLEAGEVKVNGTSLLDMSPQSAQSFFGDSGIGGHGDADVLDFYAGKQVIGRDLVDAPM